MSLAAPSLLSIMWNRRYSRWRVCYLPCCKEGASEGATEEDANLRAINTAALSECEEIHKQQGVHKEVEM